MKLCDGEQGPIWKSGYEKQPKNQSKSAKCKSLEFERQETNTRSFQSFEISHDVHLVKMSDFPALFAACLGPLVTPPKKR